MADKVLNGRIILKHDIESNWLKAVNFIPNAGEAVIYDIDENYNYERIKIGDGKTAINKLPFVNDYISDEEIDNICGNVIDFNSTMTDETTGAVYRLYVNDGKLHMKEVD